MTREQIENEAYLRLDASENEWDAMFNSGYSRGFMSGAQWRINSVWHDANEIPLHESRIFYEDTNGIVDVMHFFDGDQWDGFDDYGFEIARWAYVSDLLPERKERKG